MGAFELWAVTSLAARQSGVERQQFESVGLARRHAVHYRESAARESAVGFRVTPVVVAEVLTAHAVGRIVLGKSRVHPSAVMKMVRVRMIVLHGVVRKGGLMCVRMAPRWVEASRSIQQCQSIGQFVMEVMAGLGHHGSVVSTSRA